MCIDQGRYSVLFSAHTITSFGTFCIAFCHQIPHHFFVCMQDFLLYSPSYLQMAVRQSLLCAAYLILSLQMTTLTTENSKVVPLQHSYLSPPRPVYCIDNTELHTLLQRLVKILARCCFYQCSQYSFLSGRNVPLNPKVLLSACHSVAMPSIIDKTKPFTLLLMAMCNVGAIQSHKFLDMAGLALIFHPDEVNQSSIKVIRSNQDSMNVRHGVTEEGWVPALDILSCICCFKLQRMISAKGIIPPLPTTMSSTSP